MLCEKRKLKSSMIVTICILLVTAVLSAKLHADTVTEEWVATYDGSASNEPDFGNAVAVDTLGNVYVTGASWGRIYDYATIKYNADGTQAWVARYDAYGRSDNANSIAVDASGNVYVTGSSCDAYYNGNYATIKYDTNGNRLWIARYDGPGDGSDSPLDMALDPEGNVYVTGGSVGDGTGSDYTTIKYSTSGQRLWVARYNGPGNDDDFARSIALDAEGNVYVTGSSCGSNTEEDYATIKYDTNGNQLWVARYNGTTDDSAISVALDSEGNVYVGGESRVSGSYYYDYATIKYDSNGNQLWVAQYNGPGNANDRPADMLVDASGNVYMTGFSYGSGTRGDYGTVKYDTNGNELWVARYDASNNYDNARTMTMDTSGNIYVSGWSSTDGTLICDYATVKYDRNGNELWVARYDNPENDQDQVNDIVVDALGNVYVTGFSYGSSSLHTADYTTIKYSQTLPNEPPIADAGPDQALLELGTTVNLDGSQSYDLEGDPITYCWTMIGTPVGSAAPLSNPASAWPSFVADVYGDYVIELVVSDPWDPSDPDTIKVSFDNIKPIADAGDNQAVIVGDTVNLDGSGSSDINGDELVYSWVLEAVPAGSQAVLFLADTVTPSFVADKAGTYVVSLIVNDGLLNSDAAAVSIEVISSYDGLVQILLELIEKVNLLPDESLKNKNLKNALTNKVNEVLAMVDKGLYVDASDKLQNDILGKANGCADMGEPDKNDWITTCPEQGQVYPLIIQAIELLEGLI